MATFFGTNGLDYISVPESTITGFTGGTLSELTDATGDVFLGLGEADVIISGAGNDTIDGGAGRDFLQSGLGDDVFSFTSNTDMVLDDVNGGDGVDRLSIDYFGTGDFTTVFFREIERLDFARSDPSGVIFSASQLGTNTFGHSQLSTSLAIKGSLGDNTVEFRLGNRSYLDLASLTFSDWDPLTDKVVVREDPAGTLADLVIGSRQADRILTNGGDDTLNGYLGSDELRAGAGNDTFVFGASAEISADTIDGGEGFDGITLSEGISVFTSAVFASTGTTSIEQVVFNFLQDSVAYFNASQVNSTGLSSTLELVGTERENVLAFLDVAGVFDMSGMTFSTWTRGTDFVAIGGGAGNDQIIAAVSDTDMHGFAGSDILRGNIGNDKLEGGDDDDLLIGGLGADRLLGQNGDDGFGFSAQAELTGDTVDGGAGSDTLAFESWSAESVDLRGLTFQSVGTTSIERIELVGSKATFVTAAQFGATGLSTTLALRGASSGVIPTVFSITDVSGAFDASAFTFNNWATGATAHRVDITGTAAANTITGSLQADSLSGNDGADTLVGGAGADSLTGGDGIDVALYASSAARVIVNLFTGQGFEADAAGDRYTTIENAVGSAFNDIAVGTALSNLLGGLAGNDTLYGNAGNDTLFGDAGNDSLLGEADNDELIGGLGNDLLNGGSGNDTLFGDQDNDTLRGGAGNDSQRGSVGDDVLDGEDGNDTLNGGADQDTLLGGAGLDLLEGADGNDILYGWLGADVLWGGAGNDTLWGEQDNDTLLGEVGNDVLLGVDGNDVMYGWLGNDTLYGWIGEDVLFGEADNDRLFGEDGNDTIVGGRGRDTMTGGQGADRFFNANFEIAAGEIDLITDYDATDRYLFNTGAVVNYFNFNAPGYGTGAGIHVTVQGGVFILDVFGATAAQLQAQTQFF